MFRSIVVLASLVSPLLLTGCGKSCEQIVEEMAELGLQAAQDPTAGEDLFEEIENLQNQMAEMECFVP